jgi:hypothetical protein
MDYDIINGPCPNCGYDILHSRQCTNFCEDGYFDAADEDPINYYPGEADLECDECKGTGTEIWCPGCGANLSGHNGEDDTDFNNEE